MSRRSMNRPMNRVMTVFAALVLLVAIAAQTAPAKDTKAGVNTTMSLLNPATVAGKQLQPGDYAVTADETHVTISMRGKSAKWRFAATRSRSDRAAIPAS